MHPSIDRRRFRRSYAQLRRLAAGVTVGGVDADEVLGAALGNVAELAPGSGGTAWSWEDALIRELVEMQPRGRRRLEARGGPSLQMVSARTGCILHGLPADDLGVLLPVDRAILVLLDVEHWDLRRVAHLLHRGVAATALRAMLARRRLQRDARHDPRGAGEAASLRLRAAVTRGRPWGSDRVFDEVAPRWPVAAEPALQASSAVLGPAH